METEKSTCQTRLAFPEGNGSRCRAGVEVAGHRLRKITENDRMCPVDTQVWLADGSMGQEMRGEGWAEGAEWARLAQWGEGLPGDTAGRDLCKRRALDGGVVGGGWPEEWASSWRSSMASWLM